MLLFLVSIFFAAQSYAAGPVIWYGSLAKSIAQGGFSQYSGKEIRDCGSTDPASGSGIAAAIGSVCQYSNGTLGTLFLKTSSPDNGWVDVLTSSSGWGLFGNSGTTAGTNFVGTTDAQDLVLKADSVEGMRVQSSTGYIGINQPSPGYQLHVKAPSGIDTVMRLEGDGASSHRNYDFSVDSSGFFSLAQAGAAFYALSVGNSGTNVGIGQFGGISGATLGVYSSDSDVIPLVLRGFSAGTSNLQQWRLQDDTVVARVDSAGNITGNNLSGTNTGDVTLGTANGLSLVGQALSLGLSSTSTTGALSSTDWNIFNGKQDTISLGAFGSSPNNNGATFSSNTLTLQPADGTHPGGVSTSSQIFGGTKTFDNIVDSGLSASQAVVTDSGKQLASLAYGTASSASSLVERDSDQNAFANNFVSKSTNVVSAAGTTTLTSASSRLQNLTGTSAQTFVLPDATTLSIGSRFEFDDNSTGLLTIQANGGGAIGTVPAGGYGVAKLTANSIAAGVWDLHYWIPTNNQWGTGGLTLGKTGSSSGVVNFSGSTSGLITVQPQAAAGTYNFNLPTTAGTSGQPLLSGGGSSTAMSWGSISGNTSTFGTTSGTLTSGHCVQIDASGNLVDAGAACSSGGGSAITNQYRCYDTGGSSGGGFGSSSTGVRYFQNVTASAGSDITETTNNSTLGLVLTIATAGFYCVAWNDNFNGSTDISVTINSGSLSTSPSSGSFNAAYYWLGTNTRAPTANAHYAVFSCKNLSVNDVIRFQGTPGSGNGTDTSAERACLWRIL